MSLDVYLTIEAQAPSGSGIFVREDGATREISRQEWDEKFPGREPVVVVRESEGDREVFWRNITHNLSSMARHAGLYEYLWSPEDVGIASAGQLIGPLAEGLALLKADRARFEKFDPENGWGNYDGLCEFVSAYLEACREYPSATVLVSR